MNPNIINPGKYKKITKNDKEKKDKVAIKNIKKNRYKKRESITLNKTYIDNGNRKQKRKKKSFFGNFIRVTAAIFVIVGIGFVSKFLIDNPDSNILLSVFGNNNKIGKVDVNYDLKIGVNNLDTQNNVLVNELYKYSYKTLLNISEKYELEYSIAKNIVKVDDLNYEIEIKDASDVSNVVYTLEKFKKDNTSRYYKYLSNISSISVKNENIIAITLVNPNEYFVYHLDFKIEEKDKSAENQSSYNKFKFSLLQDGIKFLKNETNSDSVIKSISINNYTDSDEMIDNFRNDKLDCFLTSSEEDVRLIGKHEYNIKKYRDGETYFLFGNKNSELFKLKEVRKAIAYSLNRNDICKKISNSFTEVIDIPYIYSDIKYKYDIYGAENSLIAESWNKSGGIYSKKIGGINKFLSLNLLVNSEDTTKVLIADNIKLMLENIGIKVNILKLNQNEISQKMILGEYDIVLSTVNISNNPDITFLKDYLNINEVTDEAFKKVQNSNINEISKNIENLQSVLSSEIACVGIVSKNTNFVYQKYIQGFSNISYMNIFKDLKNIGKII